MTKRTTRAIYQPHSIVELKVVADMVRTTIQACRQQAAYSRTIAANATQDDIKSIAESDVKRFEAAANEIARQFNFPEGS